MPIRTALSRLLKRDRARDPRERDLIGRVPGRRSPHRRSSVCRAAAVLGLAGLTGSLALAPSTASAEGFTPLPLPQHSGRPQPQPIMPHTMPMPLGGVPQMAGPAPTMPQTMAGQPSPFAMPGQGFDPTAVVPASGPLPPTIQQTAAACPPGASPAAIPAGPAGPGSAADLGGSGFHPWPAISPFQPFNVKQTTHSNERGLWFRSQPYKGRRYRATADATFFLFDSTSDHQIGARTLPTEDSNNQLWVDRGPIFQQPNALPLSAGGAGGGGANQGIAQAIEIPGSNFDVLAEQLPFGSLIFFEDPAVFPYAFFSDDIAPVNGDDLDFVVLNDGIFPVRSTADISGNQQSGGLRLTWGWDEADGTGFDLSAFWAAESLDRYQRGLNPNTGFPIFDPTSLIIAPSFFSALDTTILGLPLDTGFSTFPFFPDLGIRGFTQKFDVFVDMTVKTEAHGANFSVLNKVLIQGDASLVRMGFGADYLYVGDQFSFYGIDSGLGYTVDIPVPNAGQIGGGAGAGGGGGAGGAGGGTRQVNDITPNIPVGEAANQAFIAQLGSRADSYMAGPTVSWQYQFGGDKFRLLGESAFSLLVNHERLRVSGENIGEQLAMKTLYNIDFLNDTDAVPVGGIAPARDTSFYDAKTHTHLSPMFKQKVTAEVPLSGIIPPLSKHYLTANSKLTLGYQLNFINRFQRAAGAIKWNGFPLFPEVRSDYTDFLIQEFRLGMQFEY